MARRLTGAGTGTGDPASLSGTSPHVVRRLVAVGVAFGGIWALALLLFDGLAPMLGQMPASRAGLWPMPGTLIAGVGLLTSLALAWVARRRSTEVPFLRRVGATYLVLTCFLFGLVTFWVPRLDAPVPVWVGLIILGYAGLVPTTPIATRVTALIAATMAPLALGLVVLAGRRVEATFFDYLLAFLPNYLCALLAEVHARLIRDLGQQVKEARELGSYRLEERLSAGGMGEVYRASHRMLARPAAIKLIRPEAMGGQGPDHAHVMRERFRREAEAVASLRSPHTVSLYDFGVAQDGRLFLAMELLDGLDLESLVRRHGPLSAGRVVHLLRQACKSLEEAHARGLVHRDIKPSNIFACRLGLTVDFVKVLDFGLVKERQREDVRLTAPARTAGTPAYMAPEMVREGAEVDHRADIYALGCVAYWLLTGRMVFQGESAVDLLIQHLHDTPLPPSERGAFEIPTELETLVLACLAKDPADRPQSAADLARRLSLSLHPARPWTEVDAKQWWRENRVRTEPVRLTERGAWVTSVVGAGVVAGALLLGVAAPAAAQQRAAERFDVGVVLDGPSLTNDSARAVLEGEVLTIAPGNVRFPARARLTGDYTTAGVNAAIERLLADKDVDLVLALGPIGSHLLATRKALAKPAIAALVIDARLQGLPLSNGTSGVKQLGYIDLELPLARTFEVFHQVVPFRQLALLVHPGVAGAIPGLAERARDAARAQGATLTLVPVTGSAADALAAIPATCDAVYLGSLDALPSAAVDTLLDGLVRRKLPAFALQGRALTGRGALVSYAAEDDLARRARRIASSIQRIQDGEDAGTLPVALPSIPQLTVNLATARAIGFSPGWQVLTDAILLHEEAPATGPRWSLAGVAREALSTNLDLKAADQAVRTGAQDTRINRAALLPQVQAEATGTMIREATAAKSLGQRAEREGAAQVVFSQSLYDDQNWAGYRIAQNGERVRLADRQRTRLDVVLRATTAYLNVLRSRAIARVEREDLALTRSNLEVAQLKERVGAAGLSDVYRWQAALAQSRRRVLDADARSQVAALELNSSLNRPLEEAFQAEDASIGDPALLVSDPRLLAYLGNPATFALFRDFSAREGVSASPEIQALEAQIASEERRGTAAKRAFFIPSLSLQGGASSLLGRSGAGAETPTIAGMPLERGPDQTWSLQLKATLPLFTGFAREAQVARASSEVERLSLTRQAAALSIAQQVRGALQLAGASWANIAQARLAADAAGKNLELVRDAYGRGAVNVITLLDAQQAALEANEAAANAVYDFLIDLMNAQRAQGTFDLLYTPAERDAWYQRLSGYVAAQGHPLP
ncbi:MAG: TolC family protein [Gemmatimonadales bacterium]